MTSSSSSEDAGLDPRRLLGDLDPYRAIASFGVAERDRGGVGLQTISKQPCLDLTCPPLLLSAFLSPPCKPHLSRPLPSALPTREADPISSPSSHCSHSSSDPLTYTVSRSSDSMPSRKES